MRWKAISGYEGYYEVSDTGLVRSLDRIIPDKIFGEKFLSGKMMKLSESKSKQRVGDGYYVVNLRKNCTSKVFLVHKLVADAFIPNERNLPTINHIDGNKHNNNVENLEWASYSYNNSHALNIGLRKPRGNAIVQMNLSGDIINTFCSTCEASRTTKINRSLISHCLNNRCNTAGGYIWKRIEECNDYLMYESTAGDELPPEAQEREAPEDIV